VVRRLRRPGIDTNWMARHQCLEPDVWHKTANGGVAFVLTEGWSTSETWGIWGVGSSHRIRLLTGATPGQHIAVDLDVHAFVWDEAAGRPVDIFVNDQFCTTVRFTKSQRLRSLTLEPLLAANEDGVLILEFRPQGVVVPKDLCLTQETRALGVALHGIRMRVSR
jgi:hypothetical protein